MFLPSGTKIVQRLAEESLDRRLQELDPWIDVTLLVISLML